VSEDTRRKLAVVTGASSGIGCYTAIGLARAGMHVVMVGRDPDRTRRARRFVAERSGSAYVETALADFAKLSEVRRLAAELREAHDRIDLLINNAGLFSPRFARSADGYELTFAVNHLAPFLLTGLLLDRIAAAAPARIVTVASEAHRRRHIDPARLAGADDGWSMLKAYGRSKLCNILFTRELAARLDPARVVAVCLHPGVVATAIGQRGGLVELGWRLLKPFMLSPERGAQTSLFLAAVPDPARFHGGYVIGETLTTPDPAALNVETGRRLWAESARLVGLDR
jgi:NAD(P)-dependent dehydrogenase (short-subunit alcohol dehydrogenase family)